MAGGIFLLDSEGGLTEMAETAFAAEVDLQKLLAHHRLIFVADAIPSELRRVVEFLNQQMDPAEVLAVEIRQYVGGTLKTLVPRVMGQTARKIEAVRPTKQWDEASFLAELTTRRGEPEAETARRILRWSEQKGCRIWWGKGAQWGSFMMGHAGAEHCTIAVWTSGLVEIPFNWLRRKPPFDAEAKRQELREKLNAVPGISIPERSIEKHPNVPLQVLTVPGALDRFLEVLEWVGEIRSQASPEVPT